jgi:hypothetical protein
MQAWKNKFSSIRVRFAAVAIAILVVFSSLLVEPVMVRLFGTPLTLTYRADYINPGFELFARLHVLEVSVEQLPASIQAIYAMDDFDAAVDLLNDQRFYLTLVEVNGIHVRQTIALTPPDEPHVVASFDWFIENRTHDWNVQSVWQNRYAGLSLRANTVQRFVVPRDVSSAQQSAMEEGTATARYALYRNRLYFIDPNF